MWESVLVSVLVLLKIVSIKCYHVCNFTVYSLQCVIFFHRTAIINKMHFDQFL